MGYRLIPASAGIHLRIASLRFATAEALVLLGVLKDTYDSTPELGDCKILADDETSAKLLATTGLLGFQNRSAEETFAQHAEMFGCCYAPLCKHNIRSREQCFEIAQLAGAWVRRLPAGLQLDLAELPAVVSRVVQEALLNVYDHAYSEDKGANGDHAGSPRNALLAITVTPVMLIAHGKGDDDVEKRWLEQVHRSGLSLEVAVGDAGLGIPRTLWQDFHKHHRRQFDRLTGSSLGAKLGQANRAELQALICHWALDYRSTRRTQFPYPALALSPRGLHKVLNTIIASSGAVVVRSGRARISYVSLAGRGVASQTAGPAEQPGTTIVARFPNKLALTSLIGTPPQPEPTSIAVDTIVSVPMLPSGPDNLPARNGGTHSNAAGIDMFCFPFSEIEPTQTDELSKLNYLISNHAPNRLFGMASLGLSLLDVAQLRSYSSDCRPSEMPPRLCALVRPEGTVLYRILGHLPEDCRPVVADLEATESAHCYLAVQEEMAEELAHVYPSLVKYDAATQTVFLKPIRVAPDEMARVFEASLLAFRERVTEASSTFVLSCQPSEAYQLASGRLVRRLFSITLLVQNNLLFAQALARRAHDVLVKISQSGDTCLVADSPSSYFLFQEILSGYSVPKIGNGVVPPGRWKHVVVFCDALWQGDSLKQCLRRFGSSVTHCLICVDLSKEGVQGLESVPSPIVLVRWPFDPHPMANEAATGTIIELDTMTNLPRVDDRYAKYDLADSDELITFVKDHPEHFRLGLHIVGGRIHTISLHTGTLVLDHAESIRKWILDAMYDWLRARGVSSDTDILLIGRQGAAISRELPALGKALDDRLRADSTARRVFVSVCANVPRDPRTIYSRSPFALYSITHGARLVSANGLFSEPLHETYMAVYIDDATISGRTMLNVLNELVRDPYHKLSAVLAIPLVLRLSPREERFYARCGLSIQAEDGARLAEERMAYATLTIRPLFRLQVQCYDTLYATPVYKELIRLAANEGIAHSPMHDYLSALQLRLGKVVREGVDCCHPWCPETVAPTLPSHQAARLRHLLALLAQNEGGLSQVCDAMLDAVARGDLAVLSLFALEPNLLELEPIVHRLQPLVIQLVEKAIEANTTSPVVSDAIAVLRHFPADFVRLMNQLVRRCIHDENLRNELSLFLVDLARSDRSLAGRLENAIGLELADSSTLKREERLAMYRLQHILSDVATGGTPEDTPASDKIEAMLRAFYVHGEWYTKTWQAFSFAVRDKRLEDIRSNTPKIVADLRTRVLPAFLGLREWSSQHGSLRIAQVAAQGYGQACAAVREFSRTVTLSASTIEDVQAAWRTVFRFLVDSDAQYFLAQEQPTTSDPPPIMQGILTAWFCSPGGLAKRMFLEAFPGASVTTSKDSLVVPDSFHPVGLLLVCTGTLPQFRDVMAILVGNIGRHGNATSASVAGAVVDDKDGKRWLRLVLRNEILQRRNEGNREGLKRALRIADEAGWHLVPEESPDKRFWTVTWTVPIAFAVSPYPTEAPQ